jgi:hypothetical protein
VWILRGYREFGIAEKLTRRASDAWLKSARADGADQLEDVEVEVSTTT